MAFSSLFRRDDSNSIQYNSTTFNLLVAFTILFFLGCAFLVTLGIFRIIRRQRQARSDLESGSSNKAHRRSRHPPSVSIANEKSAFLDDEPFSPTESVPEIRITFPEEQTADGKRQSRVVVVKIGEQGTVGYEPYQEPLPVYQEKESQRFQSLDLERIGGLKEKDTQP